MSLIFPGAFARIRGVNTIALVALLSLAACSSGGGDGASDDPPAGSGPSCTGSNVFFFAYDDDHGTELWITDCTAEGTRLVKDILTGANDGIDNTMLENLKTDGDRAFFTGDDGTNGNKLWVSDGTEAGTSMADTTDGGPAMHENSDPALIDGSLYFLGVGATVGEEPYRSDGGAPELIENLAAGAAHSSPSRFAKAGDFIYFAASDGGVAVGREVWKYDGTTPPTAIDVRVGTLGSNPDMLTALGSSLFFPADDGTGGEELIAYDGDSFLVIGFQSVEIATADPAAGLAYFAANDGGTGNELWSSDGGDFGSGTQIAANIASGPASSDPYLLTRAAGVLFFGANSSSGTELWKFEDGVASQVLEINTEGDSSPSRLTEALGMLFFVAVDSNFDEGLWVSDGTESGTVQLTGSFAPEFGQFCEFGILGEIGDFAILVFDSDGDLENELWKSDGTPEGTEMIDDVKVEFTNGCG